MKSLEDRIEDVGAAFLFAVCIGLVLAAGLFMAIWDLDSRLGEMEEYVAEQKSLKEAGATESVRELLRDFLDSGKDD